MALNDYCADVLMSMHSEQSPKSHHCLLRASLCTIFAEIMLGTVFSLYFCVRIKRQFTIFNLFLSARAADGLVPSSFTCVRSRCLLSRNHSRSQSRNKRIQHNQNPIFPHLWLIQVSVSLLCMTWLTGHLNVTCGVQVLKFRHEGQLQAQLQPCTASEVRGQHLVNGVMY